MQLLRCSACGKYQREAYLYNARAPGTDWSIVAHTVEGCGIRSIGRLLAISPTTVMARIRRLAHGLSPGPIARGRHYEVDELATYVRNKKRRVWVTCALDRQSRAVVALRVGSRGKRALRPLVETLLLADARSIRTDGHEVYGALIPNALHKVKQRGINRIERLNLALRTCLKRLARKTICFSRSLEMLRACATLFCWGSRDGPHAKSAAVRSGMV